MHTVNFEKSDVKAWSRISMRYFLLSFLLMCIPLRVVAIGDSTGGCARPTKSIETATFGTPNDMQALLVESMKWQWNRLHPLAQKLIQANVRATDEWRLEAIRNFVDAPIGCSSGEWFLDHAVAGGNIEVIKWLLDQGANPNAGLMVPHRSYESIFFRCPLPRLDRRSDGFNADQAKEKTIEAYKLLISKGADINRQLNQAGSFSRGATNALVQCLNDDMISTLLDLGINRSPRNVWNGRAEDEFDDETTRYAPLQEALWLSLIRDRSLMRVKALAQGGFNDLRGTKIDKRLRDECKLEKNQKLCREIGSIVRLSKDTIPWLSSATAINLKDSRALIPIRPTCTFPELQSHADHDLVAIAAIGEDIPAIEVSINNPRKPLFLYLESVQPKKWKIRYTNKTKILGVAVRSNSIDADEVWGLDRSTPLYVGEGCNGYIDFRGGAPKVARRSQNSKPSDPFGTAAPPHPLIVEGYKISVGDPIQNTDNPPPLAGRDALEDLVSKGKIQRSNSQIFSMWIAQEVNRWSLFKKLPKKVPPFWAGYVYPDDRWIDLPNRLRGPDANAPNLSFTPCKPNSDAV